MPRLILDPCVTWYSLEASADVRSVLHNELCAQSSVLKGHPKPLLSQATSSSYLLCLLVKSFSIFRDLFPCLLYATWLLKSCNLRRVLYPFFHFIFSPHICTFIQSLLQISGVSLTKYSLLPCSVLRIWNKKVLSWPLASFCSWEDPSHTENGTGIESDVIKCTSFAALILLELRGRVNGRG